MKRTYIALDTEATGLDVYGGAKVFSFSTCNEMGQTNVFRLDCRKRGAENRQRLQAILADSSIVKICHNFHFDCSILQANGFFIPEDTIWEDTMLMSQLLDNIAAGHSLDAVALRLCSDRDALREWSEVDNDVAVARKIYGTYDRIPEALMTRYQAADAERTMLIFQALKSYIYDDPAVAEDYRNEIELVKATIAMERRGMALCREQAEKLLSWLKQELRQVEADSFRLLGQYVNFNSSKEVLSILYDNLKLPVLHTTKSGEPSADKDTLEELRPYVQRQGKPETLEIFDCILRQRSYTKGVAMVESYIAAAGVDGIIHPHINTNRAQTGRESGENPNMQNISKEAALKNRFPVPARKCFRARPRHVLFLIDYSGIEMRLIIELTGEPELLELVRNNGDPHALAASLFYANLWEDDQRLIDFVRTADKNFNGDISKARKVLRTAAKNSQFALAYGAQLPRVAETLMLSPAEALPGFRAYCSRFPLIAGFTNKVKKQIQSTGYVTTPFGRRLRVNPSKPYSASNYMVQGTAAGIIKRAQVRVHRYLEQYGGAVALLLPIHDELILEMHRSHLSRAKTILQDVRREMITMPEIKVPLEVEVKMTTYTWNEAKEFKL